MLARHLTARDFIRQPWRNGRGVTVELAKEEDARENLLWRLSIADVVEEGPFSPFPGLDRVIMLLDGPGFDIDFGKHGGAPVTTPLMPVSFSGNWVTLAKNLRGPSHDLNLMTARDKLSAIVSVHDGFVAGPVAYRSLFFAAGDSEISYNRSTTRLEAGELLVLSEAGEAEAAGQGRVVRVDLSRVGLGFGAIF